MRSLFGTIVYTFCLVTSAAAQAPAAIVEDVQGKVDGAEFMDYIAPGAVIKVGPKATVVLGYLKSCWRETITGGTVVVGAEQSAVSHGDVQRVKVDCDPGEAELSDREASQSAATSFRTMDPNQRAALPEPSLTLYGLSPLVEARNGGTLVVERLDAAGERYTVPLKRGSLARGKFYDFADAGTALTAGGLYAASFGSHRIVFKINPHATSGAKPIIGRLLRLD